MINRLAEFNRAAKTSQSDLTAANASASAATAAGTIVRSSDVEMGTIVHSELDAFIQKIDVLKSTIKLIAKSIGDIEYLHRQALVAVSASEATELSGKIEILTKRTNAQGNSIRRTLQELDAETKQMIDQGSVSSSDLRIRQTQSSRVAGKFVETMKQFQAMQTTYRNKYRQQLERQYMIVKPAATREELDKLADVEGGHLLSQQVFAMASKAQAQTTLANMRERHQDIVQIEKSIVELHQMFADMAIIISQQGEMINKIEDFVQTSLEYTERAAIQVKEAVVAQRSLQKKKWLCMVMLLVLLLIIGIIIWQATPEIKEFFKSMVTA